jgi:putative membrane protein
MTVTVKQPVERKHADRRTLTGYLGLTALGFAMGLPGVSGSAIALILGIYEELVDAARSVLDLQVIKLLIRFKIKKALDIVPWKVILAVSSGMGLALVTTPYLFKWVLENYPSLIWAFFFGLVLASVLTVGRRIKTWNAARVLSVLAGAAGAYIFVGLVPIETPNTWWFLFLTGFVTMCAMGLPGVSGSFVLILLGKYHYLLSAVTNLDVFSLLMVVVGAGVGGASFAQVLSWLFKHYHDMTVALLTGLLLGSLRKVWPWKETVAFMLDRHGKQVPLTQINVWPAALTWDVLLAILLGILGFAVVVGLTIWAAQKGVDEH